MAVLNIVSSILAVASKVLSVPLNAPRQAAYSRAPLKFRSDGTFHIAIFEDLHFGEGEANSPSLGWGPVSDVKSIGVENTILDDETPDFVVLNGDLITGENTYLFNSTDYLDEIIAPLVNRNIPWSSTVSTSKSIIKPASTN
jgi:hypothetical protein